MNKMLVIGLDCATPELLFGDAELVHIRHLMGAGCHGRLESVNPPITVPAWMCLSTSQDPGSLGLYGFRNRADHSYAEMKTVTSESIRELTIWDQVARAGGRSILVGVPPSYPPRRINGVSVGCFLTPSTAAGAVYTHPPSVAARIAEVVGAYPVDVKGFRTADKPWLLEQIYAMSRAHFAVIRDLLVREEWDYFQFVEIGLDRIQHGFWQHHDPTHRLYRPGNPYESAIVDYYRYLDAEIGQLLELVDEDTTVLVVSDHGAMRLDGGFCINEWLIEQGLLVVDPYPDTVQPLSEAQIDWSRTTAWAAGGYYARVFLNIRGREPAGTVAPEDARGVRTQLARALEAIEHDGRSLGNEVFFPEAVYRRVEGIPPDLIVHFDGLRRRSIGSIGHRTLHVLDNDTGPDGCNHAPHGAFVLAGSRSSLRGQIDGATLLDIAPTLLELGGYDVPDSMQGRSLARPSDPDARITAADERLVRERLSGLGYIG